MSKITLEESWKEILSDEFRKDYMISLRKYLKEEKKKIIYPPGPLIFRALDLVRFKDVKVIILGQDPYHGPGQAHGLSFSVETGIKIPPSLQNIFTELQNDLGIKKPKHGNLEKWSNQGVLLLNSILTVERGKAGSHAAKGWETFTDKILSNLSAQRNNLVFILWGKKAQEKGAFLNHEKHLVLSSAHPSPYSANRGFFGSKPFSKTNMYLKKNECGLINWCVEDHQSEK
ncbi:MAG: uracil-DNA glycosylase [Betaproteobacteria bacterium TMED82]|nr:MAG: uracil-DNA glycosylase [Betaproteobacteria bacterium TMED82]|tara:strand:+ start:6214 stop:6903 length:690 start_codon:yes stop_codon:yes gene_type:complete